MLRVGCHIYRLNLVFISHPRQQLSSVGVADFIQHQLSTPVSDYDNWDGSQWVTDSDVQHVAAVTVAELYAQHLIDTAMQSVSVIQLKLQAGRRGKDETE